jgi:hypothetical protein
MLRRALVLAPLFALAAQARAEAAPTPVGQYVDLQPVALPIVADGRLVNYVFVYVRLNLAPGADVTRLRDKEPYFRDALVRAAHQTPFTLAGDYNRIDRPRLIAAMMRAAGAIAGPGAVRSVVVTSEAPQRRIATPKS